MNIQETMKHGVEEFEGKVWSANKEFRLIRQTEYLKAHQTALLEAVLEEVSGKKWDTNHVPGISQERIDKCTCKCCKHNKALQEIETIINKATGV